MHHLSLLKTSRSLRHQSKRPRVEQVCYEELHII